MDAFTGHEFKHKNGETTFYYEGGPKDGPLLIFIHGWPDIAQTWQHQLKTFAGLGFRVVAPDMRGYGKSSCPRDRRAYQLEILTGELVELLAQTGCSEAVWIGHDWGCGVVSAFVAHYPELCTGVVLLCVPYATLERGVDFLVSLVNRDIYPESEYPYGQWEYMKAYEKDADHMDEIFDSAPDKIAKIFYTKSSPATYGQPAMTSRVLREGGWFGGNPSALPDIPLELTCLDEDLYANLAKQHKERGFFPATSYYMNHDVNKKYDDKKKNDGVLDMPMLYIDAIYDGVCSPTTSPKLAGPMRKKVKNLTETRIESMHWVHMDKPAEVNAALAKWLATSLPKYWPYYYKNPLVN
ncbi:alpha/beta-hydrolase [Rhizodiscina lignyota]|uniref:Alpha/beta-hydrolase n=1 Tax=Rhizodiscina lignyota TaxID=1504668 RepID=A0A9P4IQ23_9PEZI|nr:alpha/beta-hydrolase [Rhizodiscina lignyota]